MNLVKLVRNKKYLKWKSNWTFDTITMYRTNYDDAIKRRKNLSDVSTYNDTFGRTLLVSHKFRESRALNNIYIYIHFTKRNLYAVFEVKYRGNLCGNSYERISFLRNSINTTWEKVFRRRRNRFWTLNLCSSRCDFRSDRWVSRFIVLFSNFLVEFVVYIPNSHTATSSFTKPNELPKWKTGRVVETPVRWQRAICISTSLDGGFVSKRARSTLTNIQ